MPNDSTEISSVGLADGAGIRIVVAIATSGRRDVLTDTVDLLRRQSRPADAIIICPASSEDVDTERLEAARLPVRILRGSPRGSCHQRNAIIAAAPDADVLLFIDDDFLLDTDFLRETEALFAEDPDVVVATGHVLLDGILGPGLSFGDGLKVLGETDLRAGGAPVEVYNGYGCNFAVRMAPVRAQAVRFDENLPNYAWQEDVDFSRQLARFGKIVRSERMRGVHLGSKRGRSPGKSLGYSQIANPIYLSRKGTLSWRHSTVQIARNILSNLAYSFRPEPWIDRRGRLRGNLIAVGDLLTARLSPRRILDL